MSRGELVRSDEKAIAHAYYVEQMSDAQKRMDFAVGYAQAGLKALFFVNGAAILALLTFLGNGGPLVETNAIFWAFVWFSCGVTAVLVAYVAAFFSQGYYVEVSLSEAWNAQADLYDKPRIEDGSFARRKGDRAHNAAIFSAILGLGFFVAGAFVSLDAIT